MLKDHDFKFIKDKKLRILYQTVWAHLDYIDNLSSITELDNYHTLFKAYKNGYTSNHKMFKSLLKTHMLYPDIFLDWLPVYIESKSSYLEKKHIKDLDDLYNFSKLTSKFGLLLLITDKLAKQHLNFINTISKVDVIGKLLGNDKELMSLQKTYFPTRLIEDFGIEQSLDDIFMKNEKYIALWEYLHFKVQGFMKEIEIMLIQFNDIEVHLITTYIERIKTDLKIRRDILIKYIKTRS